MSSLLTLVSATGLLDLTLKSAAIVLVAVAVAALLSGASAAWRHLVWCLSVASLLTLPLLSLALPDWRVPWLPQWTVEPTPLVAINQTELAEADRTEPLNDAAIALPPSAAASETRLPNEPRNPPTAAAAAADPSRSAMPWLAVTWATGGLLSLVPLATGLWQLAGLRRRSHVVDDHRWLTLLDELRGHLALRRSVQLRHGEAALAPLTWGALRPVVLVPCEAGGWPDERRRFVLLHELAHVRRWDWLTQLVAHFACAVYWFNPLVWLAARQMQVERERACDDIVLTSGARASDYARELLALATALSHSRPSLLAVVPMARRRELEDRLRGILDSRRNRAALTRTAVCLGAALAAAALAPLAMLEAAPLVSKESETAAPKQAPAAAPAIDLGLAGPHVEDVDHDPASPPLADLEAGQPEVKEIWDLTLEEALRSALANSKVLRNLGGLLFTPVVQSDLSHVAGLSAKDSIQDSKALRGANVRFVLARTNSDVALADFKVGVRNMISDVERAYWDVYYNYRNLAAVQAGRDSALQTWRKIYPREQGNKGGEAKEEAQARDQYFMFRAQAENSLQLLYTAESRLRYMMGLAPTDGRLIRPADEPITAEVRFELKEILPEALDRRIKRSQGEERELVQVLTNSLRDTDRNYQVSRTTFNRRVAAAKQVEATKAGYDAGRVTLDMLLDAQRRLADAEIGYYRALVDYNIAILQVHFRKGSLLERNGILLAEGAQPGFDARKK